jgi:hypothetical protein
MGTYYVFARRRADGALEYNDMIYESLRLDVWTLLHEHWRDPAKVNWLISEGRIQQLGRDVDRVDSPTKACRYKELLRSDDAGIEDECSFYGFLDRVSLTRSNGILASASTGPLEPWEEPLFYGGRVLEPAEAEYCDGWMEFMFEWTGSDWLCHSMWSEEPWALSEKAALHKRIYDAVVRDVPTVGTDEEFEALVADVKAFGNGFSWWIVHDGTLWRTRWTEATARRYADFLAASPDRHLLYMGLGEDFPLAQKEALYRSLGRSDRRIFSSSLPDDARERIDREHPPVLTEEEKREDALLGARRCVEPAWDRRKPVTEAMGAVPVELLAELVRTLLGSTNGRRGAVRVLAGKPDGEIPSDVMPAVLRERKNAQKASAKAAAGVSFPRARRKG